MPCNDQKLLRSTLRQLNALSERTETETPATETGRRREGGLLSPPVVPFSPNFFGEGSPTKVDVLKKVVLILTSLQEDLGH